MLVASCHIAQLVIAFVPHRSHLVSAFYLLRHCHVSSVMIFFVLSGYLVGGSVISDLRVGRFDLRRYLINRVTRLYVVLIPALLLSGVWDFVGLHWLNIHDFYNDGLAIPEFDHTHVGETLTWRGAFWNLLSCQTIQAPVLGSNLPLWSLANEFWYYLLCPAVLLAWQAGKPWTGRVIAALATIFILWFVGRDILLFGIVWAAGAWAASWRGSLRVPPLGLVALLAVTIYFDATGSITHWLWVRLHGPWLALAWFLPNLLVGLVFCALLLAVRSSAKADQPLRGERVHNRLADFSYSLYLSHYPFAMFILAAAGTWLGFGIQMAPSLPAFAFLGGLIVLTYAYAYGIYWCTERHTPAVRKWCLRRFAR
jgi:peptidoglycan/LPS O-acetylase OafA/YrhL